MGACVLACMCLCVCVFACACMRAHCGSLVAPLSQGFLFFSRRLCAGASFNPNWLHQKVKEPLPKKSNLDGQSGDQAFKSLLIEWCFFYADLSFY